MANYLAKGASANGSVYVCNLPPGTDEDMLAEFFGTIGLLKKDKRTGRPKIWLYRDKVTNEPKGDATVTYEDPYAAQAAIEWFNNKEFHGTIIEVLMAESKNSHNMVTPLVEPSLVSDVVPDESTRDTSEGVIFLKDRRTKCKVYNFLDEELPSEYYKELMYKMHHELQGLKQKVSNNDLVEELQNSRIETMKVSELLAIANSKLRLYDMLFLILIGVIVMLCVILGFLIMK